MVSLMKAGSEHCNDTDIRTQTATELASKQVELPASHRRLWESDTGDLHHKRCHALLLTLSSCSLHFTAANTDLRARGLLHTCRSESRWARTSDRDLTWPCRQPASCCACCAALRSCA